jgi:predicted phosphoadenosine phosphosulfate sulfurtransferase
MWENRCYNDGIPDRVPKKVMASNRAPSWKAVAIAILKNDHNLLSLGYSPPKSSFADKIKAEKRHSDSNQLCMEYSFIGSKQETLL